MTLHSSPWNLFVACAAALVLSVGLAACGDDSGSTPMDSGMPPDGNMSADGGMTNDAGTPSDAGSTVDASAPVDGSSGPGIDISGAIAAGATVPAGAKVIVIWSVSTTSPDYEYKFGEGTATASGFTVHFAGTPPADAVNNAGGGLMLGVGTVVLVSADTTIPDGRLATAFDLSTALGASPQGAIIWREGNFSGTGTTWPDAFPMSMVTCGACMAATMPMTFDAFTPADCSTLEVMVGDPTTFSFCNWT